MVRTRSWILGVGLLAGTACTDEPVPPSATALRAVEIMRVEDRRPEGDARRPLLDALDDPEPGIRLLAVRALGRLEDVGLLPEVEPLLDDPNPLVRAEAYNAVAQMGFGRAEPEIFELLSARARAMTPAEDPLVRGVLGRSLGRLRVVAGEDVSVRARVVTALAEDGAEAAVQGVLHGLYHLARSDRDVLDGASGVRAWVAEQTERSEPRSRTLAAMALAQGPQVSSDRIRALLDDPEPTVRKAAAEMIGEGMAGLAMEALDDPVYFVRIAALRSLARSDRDLGCAQATEALADAEHLVRMAALQILTTPCDDAGVRTALTTLAEGIDDAGERGWHEPTQALVSLASVAPARAATLLDRFARHGNPFVRAHAARAAGLAGDGETVRALTQDASANVRTAAITALWSLVGHAADDAYLAQLESTDDPQLALTAAQRLRGSTDSAAVVDGAFLALERFGSEGRETFRDPRMEALERISELGVPADAERLEPYLSDYDPAVASRVADIINDWTDRDVEPAPVPRAGPRFPDARELARLRSARVTIEMAFGGEITIELLPDEAPTNAARFVRLTQDGYFDGLTFHRVVPNFIVQGGSPAANEYYGDGPFTRDELGLTSHWRGTVGLSTRGRDTGDGQIFVNTVHNLRLDHNYTVFGVVVSGMDVVDAIREGDVIREGRVEYR